MPTDSPQDKATPARWFHNGKWQTHEKAIRRDPDKNAINKSAVYQKPDGEYDLINIGRRGYRVQSGLMGLGLGTKYYRNHRNCSWQSRLMGATCHLHVASHIPLILCSFQITFIHSQTEYCTHILSIWKYSFQILPFGSIPSCIL